MNHHFEYRSRSGSLSLSVFALAGLTLLAAVIWTVAPVFALILGVPAIAACFYQLVASPVYGVRLSRESWQVFSETADQTIPLTDIAHVRFSDRPGAPRCTLALNDGTNLALPDEALPKDLMGLIRETSAKGLRIRQA